MVEYVTTGQPMTWWQYLKNVKPQRVSSFISNNLEMHEFYFCSVFLCVTHQDAESRHLL